MQKDKTRSRERRIWQVALRTPAAVRLVQALEAQPHRLALLPGPNSVLIQANEDSLSQQLHGRAPIVAFTAQRLATYMLQCLVVFKEKIGRGVDSGETVERTDLTQASDDHNLVDLVYKARWSIYGGGLEFA